MIALGARPARAAEPSSIPAQAPRRRPRVLFLINSLAGGGAERVMTRLLMNSREWLTTHEIALALLDDDPCDFSLPDWLQVFQLDCQHRTLKSIRAVAGLVAAFEPDLTLSFLTRSNIASGLAMMKHGRPWIISERTSTSEHLGSGTRQLITKLIIRLVYPRSSRLIAVSEGVAASLARHFAVPRRKIEVIPNPVDSSSIEEEARETNTISFERPYVIAMGRLVRVKNHRMLIRAFARANLPARLVIAGEGPERPALEELARELGLEERVLMPGWLSNPYPALSQARVFALSSDVEGFPNSLLEALLLGVPAVSTRCSDGPAEILGGSKIEAARGPTIADAGVLTRVGDVDAFARGLELAFDSQVGKRLAAAGLERAKRFSEADAARRYWALIEGELERAEAARPG